MLIALLLLPTGCARVPEPATYDYSAQQKMQASHHWDVLAADLANEINTALILGDHLMAPVYVRETCGNEDQPCEPARTTVFNEAFRDLLITHLVRLGVPTATTPARGTITVHYKAQPVYHHAQRMRTIKPGLLTSLSAAVIVLRNAPWEVAAIALAGGLDALNAAYASLDRFEVVVTTSMVVNERYLYRNTSIYFINTKDSWHYQTGAEPAQIKLIDAAPAIQDPPQSATPVMPLPAPPLPMPDDTTI